MVGPPSDQEKFISDQIAAFSFMDNKNKVFFTFDYENDFFRANVVRNAWVSRYGQAEGFWEDDVCQKLKQNDESYIDPIISQTIEKSAATIVLIGTKTSELNYVRYAICQSRLRGKGVVGIYIHNIKDESGKKAAIGSSRFGEIDKDENNESLFFWQLYPLYRWVIDDGESHLMTWVKKACNKINGGV